MKDTSLMERRDRPTDSPAPRRLPTPRVAPSWARPRPVPFQRIVHGVRWGTLVAAFAVAALRGPMGSAVAGWGVVLMAYAVWRTVRPLDLQTGAPKPLRPGQAGHGVRATQAGRAASALALVLEIAVPVMAVVSTGYWDSPFAFCILTGVTAAGFTRGYAFALRLAAAASLAVSVPYLITARVAAGPGLQVTGQWVIELVLVGVLAGYARRLFGEAEQRHTRALDRMAQLAEANELLVSLHRVAQQLPASLNLDTVLASTVSRLASIIESDVTAVLLRDDTTGRWVVAAGRGTRIGRSFADHELPVAVATTTTSSVSSLVVCVEPGEGLGSELLSHTGLYAPLRTRGTLIGLVALEHHAPGSYGRRELQLLDGFVEAAALSIDNARWFARLRAIGADEERVRIARDMHDRIGQSLAGLAFGLDRIHRQVTDERLREDINGLRTDVRAAVGEVRETLGDLRTDVTEERGLIETLSGFLERVEDRTGLEVNFTHRSDERLPLVQERELWRIAQEAITNVERHARARHLRVFWEYDGLVALLAVADDGDGFDSGRAGRRDSFGIKGMRERADAIGASLEIDSIPSGGTAVKCRLVRA